MKKVKITPNPDFDFVIGYVGGFDDVPTKQDKYKPLRFNKVIGYDDKGVEKVLNNVYILNEKRRILQKKFESHFIEQIKQNVSSEHPYSLGTKLEVVIAINLSTKRMKNVDLDNLVKLILDCFNGIIYEDDSQIVSIIASKSVINDEFVPEVSGVMVGIRKIENDKKTLNNVNLYYMEEINE